MPDANPVFPTPVGPINTMFSALGTNSSSAKARICLRLTPGWRAKGNVSSDQRSGRLALRIRHSKACSCRACHWARIKAREKLGIRDVLFFSGAQLFLVDIENTAEVEILQQLIQFFIHGHLLLDSDRCGSIR